MYMSSILNNSIWPNGMKVDSEGYAIFYPLGTNKVDISTVTWPMGDKIISPFIYDENDKLVGFVDTKTLTVSGSATTTMNYSHIEADFSSISEGSLTVNAPNATVKKFKWAVSTDGGESFDFVIIDFNTTDQETIDTVRTAKRVVNNKLYDADDNLIGTLDTSKIEVGGFDNVEDKDTDGLFCNRDAYSGEENDFILSEFDSDLSSLREGTYMFCYCSNLNSFSSDLSNLTNGEFMFDSCENLKSFTSDLSSLVNGYCMFCYCYELDSFSSDSNGSPVNLSNLTNGEMMFYGTNFTSFSIDLPSLTTGDYMFVECYNLTSFSSDLSSLTDGRYMYESCKKLTTFTSDLSSLTTGYYMFYNCKNLTSFTSDLSSLTDGEKMFYECKLDAPSVKNIIDTINTYSGKLTLGIGCNAYAATDNKDLFAQEVGYTDMASLLATLQTKGWTVTAQYNGRPTTTYGLRRPSEDTLPVFVKLEETEKYADYTSEEDGSKKYRLDWFHETTGSTEGYTQYATLEEAIESLNIKPIERN